MSTRLSWGRGVLAFLRREPLFYFTLLGAALFAGEALLRGRSETIRIGPEAAAALIDARRTLLGRALTREEERALLEGHVDREVLYREALRRGLDRHDPVVHGRLVEKMRLLLEPLPREPSPGELEALFRERSAELAGPERVSFEHVYFASDAPAAFTALAALKRGTTGAALGEPFWLGTVLEGYSQADLTRWLGESFARSVFAAVPGEWKGPIASSRGVHLVRVTARQRPEPPQLVDVEAALREEWKLGAQRAALAEQIRALRARYRVVLPEGPP